MPLCLSAFDPIEFQVPLTFIQHLNYKFMPESDQLQDYLINNQLMVASQSQYASNKPFDKPTRYHTLYILSTKTLH